MRLPSFFRHEHEPVHDLRKKPEPTNILLVFSGNPIVAYATITASIILFIILAYLICGVSATGDTIYNLQGVI